ncbi:MAG: hypothetical protein ACOCUT_01140 [bacterium]
MDMNNNLIAEAAKMESKWGETGLLEGIEDEHTRRNTALLLENQNLANSHPMNEALTGGTDTSDVAQFRRISIPLVRRIYPQLIANKIVSVQPLLGPTGLVYYLRFRYGSDKGSTLGSTNKDYAVGTSEADNITMQQQTDGDANLDIWYAHQRVNNESVSGVYDSTAGSQFDVTFGQSPIQNNQQLYADPSDANANDAVTAAVAGGYPGAYGTSGSNTPYIMWGTMTITDDDGGDSATADFAISSASSPVITVDGTKSDGSAWTETVTATGSSSFTFTLVNGDDVTTNLTVASIVFNPSNGTLTADITGSDADDSFALSNVVYEYDMECNVDLPEVNLVVESETVSAKTRKLKAVWSFEAQQDLRSQHNIDAEAELTQVLAKEINLEIDREIITDLRVNAGTTATWDFSTALGDTIKEKYESLYVKVVEVSNIIHRKTLRGGANWMITSPEVASIFETSTAGFAPAPSNNFESSLGIQYIGTVNNRWRLYKDPLFPRGSILLGYRGDSYMDSGYFYCPYVPLTQTPVVLDPDSFCPRRGVLTRYGKKLLREGARFYARISIQNFVI